MIRVKESSMEFDLANHRVELTLGVFEMKKEFSNYSWIIGCLFPYAHYQREACTCKIYTLLTAGQTYININ